MLLRHKLTGFVSVVLLSACSMAPEYKVPDIYVSEKYKATKINTSAWVSYDQIPKIKSKENWWSIFDDPVLDSLIKKLNERNYTLEQSYAKYQASLSQIQSAQSSYYPNIGADASANRSGGSNRNVSERVSYGANLKWEIDLWGKFSDRENIARLGSEMQALMLEQTKLSLQAQLVDTYFMLRVTDLKIDALKQIISYLERSHQININQYNQGVIAKADVISSEMQLFNAKANLISTQSSRILLENAISTLIGLTPAEFNLMPTNYKFKPISIPVVYPSVLLALRPDIQIAEKKVQEANYKIGTARSAWFPNLTLSASASNQGINLTELLSSPISVWSLGPAIVLSIFDGGAKQAALNSAKAEYRSNVAAYKDTVIKGIREVEDALSKIEMTSRELNIQSKALSSSRKSLEITNNQYKAGLVSYLNVIQVQNSNINSEIQNLNLKLKLVQNQIELVKALGGNIK